MNFPQRNRYKRKPISQKVFAIFVVLLLLIVSINYTTNGSIGNIFRPAVVAVLGVGPAIDRAVSPFRAYIESKRSLISNQLLLENKVRTLEFYALNNKILSSENTELRAIVRGSKADTTGTLERILTTAGLYPYGVIVISVKKGDTILTGDTVFAQGKIIIGTIASVQKNNAIVTLLSASGITTKVVIISDTAVTSMEIQGIGLGNMQGSVARGIPISIGDVVTKNGAVVGYVRSIDSKQTDAFQKISIKAPIAIDTTRFVTVRHP